ncbi:uncharacterized protein LOC113516756 isoform X2 [Galleria mellonella]|uniref:Uncharacterized protein LOC113516756 isoform X2 n=1 Tax=Galleria mellonella TaxID=7137 RepID=A0ABM3MZS2_GALME|nr:uncharacterized protein LOC113516756 isoform X2 [Galleria mellonella]
MNPKKTSVRKRHKQIKSPNVDNTEVFVLPPNLLEKLGINLGNVTKEFSTESSTKKDVTSAVDPSSVNKDVLSNVTSSLHTNINNYKETSMLETANLMKKSVFLSPTFLPTIANAIPGEMEIAKISIQSENNPSENDALKENINHVVSKTPGNSDGIGLVAFEEEELHSNLDQQICLQNFMPDKIVPKSIQKDNEISEIVLYELNINDNSLQNTEGNISIEAQPDVVENSNNNSREFSMQNSRQSRENTQNKVNIISQEILAPSQFREIKALKSPNCNSLIPVPVNAILSMNKKNDNLVIDTPNCEQNVINDINKNEQIFELHIVNNEKDFISEDNQITNNLKLKDIKLEKNTLNNNNINLETLSGTVTCKNNIDTVTDVLPFHDQCMNYVFNTNIQLDSEYTNNQCKNFASEAKDIVITNFNMSSLVVDKSNDIISDVYSFIPINNIVCDNDKDVLYVKEIEVSLDKCTQNDCQEVKTYNNNICMEENMFEENVSELNIDNQGHVNHSEKETISSQSLLTSRTIENISHTNITSEYSSFVGDESDSENVSIITNTDTANNNAEVRIRTYKNINADSTCENCQQMKQFDNGKNKHVCTDISKKHTADLNQGYFVNIKCNDIGTNYGNLLDNSIHSNNFEIDPKNNLVDNDIKDFNLQSNQLQSNNNLMDNTITITTKSSMDKIGEIASYLSQYSQLRKNKSKALINKQYHNDSKNVLSMNVKSGMIKSKLCIQGVEKPGGNEQDIKSLQNPRSLKSYSKKRRQKRLHKDLLSDCNNIIGENTKDTAENIDCDNDLKINNVSNLIQEFCLCADFGRLAYYDCVNLYEHIHFWNHPTVNCSTDTVLSIYSEDSNLVDRDLVSENLNDDSFDIVEDTCWNVMDCYKGDLISTINVDSKIESNACLVGSDLHLALSGPEFVNGPENIVHISNVTTGKVDIENVNRKEDSSRSTEIHVVDRSDVSKCSKKNESFMFNGKETSNINPSKELITTKQITSDNAYEKSIRHTKVELTSEEKKHRTTSDIEDEESSKKNVKCAVCGKRILNVEWERHISEQHCYIAWKAGDNFNCEDFELINKLKGRLNSHGFLKCYQCDVEINKLNVFIPHIRNCLKLKVSDYVDSTKQKDNRDADSESNSFSVDKLNKNNEKVNAVDIKSTRFNEVPSDGGRSFKHHITSDDSHENLNKKYVKCGVCEQMIVELDWKSHISEEHCFIAWKAGDNFNWENLELVNNLKERLKSNGFLKCYQCDIKIKKTEKFLSHIKICLNLKGSNSVENGEQKDDGNKDQRPVYLPVEELNAICGKVDNRNNSGLSEVQNERGRKIESSADKNSRKSEDKFNCNNEMGIKIIPEENVALDKSTVPKEKKRGRKRKFNDSYNSVVKCGVCEQMIVEINWKDHISEDHCFIAWKAGENFNWEDLELINNLKQRLKSKGFLKCNHCDAEMKKPKTFLTHMKDCLHIKVEQSGDEQIRSEERTSFKETDEKLIPENSSADTSVVPTKKRRGRKRKTLDVSNDGPAKPTVTCGVCKHVVDEEEWKSHVSGSHNFVAWKDGDDFDYGDPELFNTLKEKLNENGFLICTFCDIKIKSVKRFLTHVQKCAEFKTTTAPQNTPKINDIKKEPGTSESPEMTTCGVCMQDVENRLWVEHISSQHHYLAWKDGEKPLDLNDEDMLKRHLVNMVQEHGALMCVNCGLFRKYTMKTVKCFLGHIKTCGLNISFNQTEVNDDTNTSTIELPIIKESMEVSLKQYDVLVRCAVCQESMNSSDWIEHISKQHNYLAWKVGDEVPNLEDETSLWQYLYNIAKQENGLICSKCGLVRKYVKSYLHHIKICNGDNNEGSNEDSVVLNSSTTNVNILNDLGVKGPVQCGVCNNTVEENQWITHIQQEHGYLARVSGQPPLDVNDSDMVYEHLYTILKKTGSLMCNVCGLIRKYVKKYMEHVQSCTKKNLTNEEGMYVCAVCNEKVLPLDWKNHSMDKHYNVAWVVGDKPIDLTSTYGAEKNIKEYKEKYGELVCKTCGVSRSSYMGFYAHIITCGKTDEETEMYKVMCDICNCKYLSIYKSQHMGMHREQEYAKERKQRAIAAQGKDKDDVLTVTGPRRAAVKAKSVIDNYKEISEFKYKCSECGFGTDVEMKFSRHKCKKQDFKCVSDSENSEESEDESDDSDVDSDISDEEEQTQIKRRRRRGGETNASSKISRIPFAIKDIKSYLEEGFNDYTKLILTSEKLFPQFQECEFEAVSKDEESQYLPLLKESCKVKFSSAEWMTYNRFEAKKKGEVTSMFVGGSIQRLSWVPPLRIARHDEGDACKQFVSVACHCDADCPRNEPDQLITQKSLIQIWDLGYLNDEDVPEFVLGLALDYGTVWATDWCPSGARDIFLKSHTKPDSFLRIGLLAVACSNGLAYIFSVPYPSSITKSDQKIYKLKPVAELRFAMNSDRKKYQASSICWSKQKDHTTVIVGYADGSSAYFDLNTESPLLRTVENGVTVLYPYYDERPLNSCITDISTYPNIGQEGSAGVAALVGPTGAALATRPAAAPPRLQLHLAYSSVAFAPGWPTAMISGDEAVMNQSANELEVWGCGRRLGLMQACCGCERCGCVVAYMPPYMRTMRIHPARGELNKKPLAVLKMMELNGRKRKHVKDELAIKLEPLTYEAAIEKYGIELTLATRKNKNELYHAMQSAKDVFPERFPLSDVATLAFCPSGEHHRTLAVATHAGLVFFLKV